MKPALHKLLLRAPLRTPDDQGVLRNHLFVLECGHRRDPLGYYQRCEACAAIPHPRTNPNYVHNTKGATR